MLNPTLESNPELLASLLGGSISKKIKTTITNRVWVFG